MFIEVLTKFLYELDSLSNKAGGISEEWMGGTPGISKYAYEGVVDNWVVKLWDTESKSMNSVEKPGGRVMVGRCWNVRDGLVAETVAIYLSVAPVSKVAGIMSMITESEVWQSCCGDGPYRFVKGHLVVAMDCGSGGSFMGVVWWCRDLVVVISEEDV
nr:hypothetical protein [Tanacetum cinerariifolium]